MDPRNLLFTMDEERHAIRQLARTDHISQKILQWLEGELRRGRLPPDARNLREAVIQCLGRADLKVKRWALNVLSEIGIQRRFDVLDQVFPFVDGDPDLLASAIRLLFREATQSNALKILGQRGLAAEGLVLIAGAEFSAVMRKRLVNERIPLENASSDQLRAAVVLTGKGKAPENLFLSKHPNAIALSELNLHDDPGVVKYSLWGLAELNLGFDSLKLNIDSYDSCEPQVRKWMLRLLFSDEAALAVNIDLIWHGAKDENIEVREEAAIGLRRCYVPNASSEIRRWFSNEDNELVRNALLEHIASHARLDLKYEEITVAEYQRAANRGARRARIEACVRGTSLYGRLRAIDLKQEAISLLSNDNDFPGVLMPKIEQNFPNATIGNVTATGHITVENQQIVSGVTSEKLAEIIAEVTNFNANIPDVEQRAVGSALINEVEKEPSKSKFGKMVQWVKSINAGLESGSNLLENGEKLVETLDDVMLSLGV